MKIAAVTCTGGRDRLLALCERWIGRQTVQPDLWIVSVDDGSTPNLTLPHVLTRPPALPPGWGKPNIAKQNWNLHHALLQVPPDHCAVVFEDDDWYAPDHIEASLRGFEVSETVCQPVAFGFYLPTQTFCIHQKQWPTEGMVALRPDGIRRYAKCLPMHRDMEWWKRGCMVRKMTCVQIKGAGRGIPGRPGTTQWQMSGAMGPSYPDPNYSVFRQIVGDEDASAYLSLIHAPSPV